MNRGLDGGKSCGRRRGRMRRGFSTRVLVVQVRATRATVGVLGMCVKELVLSNGVLDELEPE